MLLILTSPFPPFFSPQHPSKHLSLRNTPNILPPFANQSMNGNSILLPSFHRFYLPKPSIPFPLFFTPGSVKLHLNLRVIHIFSFLSLPFPFTIYSALSNNGLLLRPLSATSCFSSTVFFFFPFDPLTFLQFPLLFLS